MTYFEKVKLGLAYNFKSPWKTYKKFLFDFYSLFPDFLVRLGFVLVFAFGAIIGPIYFFIFSMIISPFLLPIVSKGKEITDDQWEMLREVKEKSDKSEMNNEASSS